MSTMSMRLPARLIAAPLILTVLVTGQAAAHAEPAPVAPASLTASGEAQVLAARALKHERALDAIAANRQREIAQIGERIVAAAAAQAGKPYVWGATGPSAFDCSGLTGWAYAAVGIDLPRSSAAQASLMTPVSEPMLGDLVYMPGHIGIYAGNGKMWHAPRSGDVVKLSTIWSSSFRYGRVR